MVRNNHDSKDKERYPVFPVQKQNPRKVRDAKGGDPHGLPDVVPAADR